MRTAPINLRAMPSQRDLIDYASQLLGKTRSDFMLEVACDQAKNVILDQTFFQLDSEKYQNFVAFLDNPTQSQSSAKGLKTLMAVKPIWEQT